MMVEGEGVIEKQIGPILYWSHVFFCPIFSFVPKNVSLDGESLMMVKGERVIEKQIGPIDPD